MGGAASHIKHLWENPNLTGNDLKNIFSGLQNGNIKAIEKVDGQNLQFSYRDHGIICARKKIHLKDNGKNAIKLSEIKDYFGEDTPDIIRYTYYSILQFLDLAIKKGRLASFFDEGKVWINAEILNSNTVNVIPYYKDYIVFHEIFDENETFNDKLYKIADDFHFAGGLQYIVEGPQMVIPNTTINFDAKVDDIMINDGKQNSIGEFMEVCFEFTYKNKFPEVDKEVIKDLAHRWGWKDKSKNIRTILKGVPEPYASDLRAQDKNDEVKHWQKQFSYPIVELITEIGCKILNNITPYFCDIVHIESAKKKIFYKVDDAVNILFPPENIFIDQTSKYSWYLDMYLIGGEYGIAAMEGIVFDYMNETYKLLGVYPGILQLLWGAKDVKKKLLETN